MPSVINRRSFLGSALVALAGCAHVSRKRPSRLPLGFSTLGCPTWEWSRILDFAATHGFAGIEIRGLLRDMDLSASPVLAAHEDVKRDLAARDLRVACLGSSAELHETDPGKRDAFLAEARRFIDLAHDLGAPFVRVFGNKYVSGVPRGSTRANIARTLHDLAEYARPNGVAVLVESHGDFTDSAALQDILTRADSPAAGLLWDAHHTFVAGKEAPEDTVRQLGRWIRHTHLKDSIPAGNDRRYVLTGTGEVPVRRQIEALARIGYRGMYSFEWEKRWQPEIEEPEIALAQFASVAAGYLRDAGVRAVSE
jgi:sugar phosphate isomerase/epimerase